MAKKKEINERCPFQSECERKKCEFQFREAKCNYYISNAMPGHEIEDQKRPEPSILDEAAEVSYVTDSNVEDEKVQRDIKITMIPITKLHPHPDNPRKNLGDITELTESIREQGIMQNLTVVKATGYHYGDYTVVIGHRRMAAAKAAGLEELPCAIVELSEKEQLATMLSENVHRNDLTVNEQAMCVQMMFDLGDSAEEVSKATGFSKTKVYRYKKIASLGHEALQKVEDRQITLEDYDELFKIEDEEKRSAAFLHIGTKDFSWAVSRAKQEIESEKRKQRVLDILKDNATEIELTSGYEIIKSVYSWDYDSFKLPDTDEELFYRVVNNVFYIYRKMSEEEISAAVSEQHERELEREKDEKSYQARREREKKYRELKLMAYLKRREFFSTIIKAKSTLEKHKDRVISYINKLLLEGHEFYDDDKLKEFIGIDALPLDEDEDVDYKKFRDLCEEKASPLGVLLAIAYVGGFDDVYEGYSQYDYNYQGIRYCKNEQLDLLYELMRELGYELSLEEEAFIDGTHELYSEAEY